MEWSNTRRAIVKVWGIGWVIGAQFGLLADDQAGNSAGPVMEPTGATVSQQPINSSSVSAPAKANDSTAKVTAARPASLSYVTVQIEKLLKSGVEPSIIKAYVENSTLTSPPTAEEIIYLRDQGLSSDIVARLIDRGNQTRPRLANANVATQNSAAPSNPVTVYSSPDPTVIYERPVYPYVDSYWYYDDWRYPGYPSFWFFGGPGHRGLRGHEFLGPRGRFDGPAGFRGRGGFEGGPRGGFGGGHPVGRGGLGRR